MHIAQQPSQPAVVVPAYARAGGPTLVRITRHDGGTTTVTADQRPTVHLVPQRYDDIIGGTWYQLQDDHGAVYEDGILYDNGDASVAECWVRVEEGYGRDADVVAAVRYLEVASAAWGVV